jgi:YidC/Oxa1 family membrane protein insertase
MLKYISNLPLAWVFQSGESFDQLLRQTGFGTYKGITGYIANAVIVYLVFAHSAIGDYGIAIILLAIFVRLLMLNLTIAQIRMMRIQQYINPLQKRITERYKGDKTTQNRLTMELYQRFKLNPMASCMAMIVQLPVFFGVYRALYDKMLIGQSFMGMQLLFPMNLYYARSFSKDQDLTKIIFDYIQQHGMWSQVWRWSLQYSGKTYEWALYWPALLLVIIYVISSYYLQRMIRQASQPDPEIKALIDKGKKPRADGTKPPPDFSETMQKNMRWMNLMMVVIAFILSTGALLYFFMQNVLMVLEYTFIPRLLKLSFSAAEISEMLVAIDKGHALVEKPAAEGEAAAAEEEEITQAPLRRSQARGFKKK